MSNKKKNTLKKKNLPGKEGNNFFQKSLQRTQNFFVSGGKGRLKLLFLGSFQGSAGF